MKILIIGASGYVGARLFSDFRDKYEVVGTYHNERLFPELLQLDITDPGAVKKLITTEKPEIIVHVANNASVKWCEANPDEARLLNEESTRFIADAANDTGASLVYISSFAANNPVHVYGKTKLASEEITKNVKAGWLIIRPSLVVGVSPNTTSDRFFNRILWDIDKRVDVAYDSSWTLQLTSLSHLSKVMNQAISRRITEEIIPVAIDEKKSQFDFAKDILSSFNIKVSVHDKGDPVSEPHIDLGILSKLELPTGSYGEIIKEITTDIKELKSNN